MAIPFFSLPIQTVGGCPVSAAFITSCSSHPRHLTWSSGPHASHANPQKRTPLASIHTCLFSTRTPKAYVRASSFPTHPSPSHLFRRLRTTRSALRGETRRLARPQRSLQTMSAWSSSTGKPQLSYADRLRHASKSSAGPNHDSLSAAAASSSSSAFAPSSSHPPSATDASRHNASLVQRPDIASTSPHTKQSPGNASTPAHAHAHAHAHPTSSTEASTTAPSHASTTARNDAAPTLNVWEARRKQIAEREAEKSRERQQSPAHQRNDPPSSKASIAPAASNPNHGATKPKLATAPLATTASSKKGAKPSSNPTASDKKNTKPTNQSATANPASASSQPASSLSDTKVASASASSSSIAPSAAKPTTSQASQALQLTREQSSKHPTPQPASSTPSALANSAAKPAEKPSAEPKDTSNHANNNEHRVRREPAQSTPASERGTAARAQSASTPSSRQPAPTPMPMHDDIPGSPATVASAIEEVLKNGGPNGAQTEDDDAWLARIHLLNGGQNMPKFGGIGPNGAPASAARKRHRQPKRRSAP